MGAERSEAAPAERVALRLSRPLGHTCLGAIVILFVMVGLVEAASRLPGVQDRLPAPSLGTGHRQFEIQWARLEDYIAQEGPPDCILLGNSMVRTALDPDLISAAYQAQTGAPIRCFNLGINGLDAPTAASLAQLLVLKVHPRLLVLGVTTLGNGQESMVISSSPWVQEQLGHSSLDGWLADHSRAFRYYLLLLDWVKTPDLLTDNRRWEAQIEAHGYSRLTEVLQDPGGPLDPGQEEGVNMRLPATADEFEAFYTAMDDISQLRDRVQIVAIETALHPSFLLYFEGGESQYVALVDQIGQYLTRKGIEFWPTMGTLQIPDGGWKDRDHLNITGAQVFSEWFGRRLGQAVTRGLLAGPAR